MTATPKKAGVLTFHAGLNHGGFLQAHCLSAYLRKLGWDSEIINYRNLLDWWRQDVRPWGATLHRPGIWRRRRVKWRAFQSAFRAEPWSPRIWTHTGLSRREYDLVVIGSDVVWNQEIFGYDPAYYGQINAKRLVAYAASFGWMPPETKLSNEAVNGLRSFDELLVRDVTTQGIVEAHLGAAPDLVVDPTLLDLRNRETAMTGIPPDDHLVIYAHSFDREWEPEIARFCENTGSTCVTTGYHTGLPGEEDLSLGPHEWVDRMNRARAIVTNTFHGVLYAVMSKRPFAYLYHDASILRVSSFLESIGAEDRIVREPDALIARLTAPQTASSWEKALELSDASGERLAQAVVFSETRG